MPVLAPVPGQGRGEELFLCALSVRNPLKCVHFKGFRDARHLSLMKICATDKLTEANGGVPKACFFSRLSDWVRLEWMARLNYFAVEFVDMRRKSSMFGEVQTCEREKGQCILYSMKRRTYAKK